MIKVSKNMSLLKIRETRVVLSNTDNFLAFFIVFEWDRTLQSAMDK